jgi:hypothetical protein
MILLEGEKDVEQFIGTKKEDNQTIITFDVFAHRLLKEKNIIHEMVEDFFDQESIDNIDNKAIQLSLEWYKQENFEKYIEYDGFNLVKTVELELVPYFFTQLKKCMGIINVVDKVKPTKIIGYSLSNMIKTVCDNKKVSLELHPQKVKQMLYHDQVEIPLNFGSKLFTIKISKKQFEVIKKIKAKTFDFIYDFSPTRNDLKDSSILLLEFNPIPFASLLGTLNKMQRNVILLNQRRPAIWNKDSLRIIKKTGSKVANIEDMSDRETRKQIIVGISELEKKLNIFWKNEEFFNNKFSIYNESFWNAIKDDFIIIINQRLTESVRIFHLSKKFLEITNVKKILEWSHLGTHEKIIIYLAKRMKIPIILLQHALFPLGQNWEKYHSVQAILPTDGVREAVWGKSMRNYLVKHGVKEEEIFITGSPKHDSFFNEKSVKSQKTILLAFNGLFTNNFNGTDSRIYDYYEECIKEVFSTLKKNTNKQIVVKLHPAQVGFDIKPIIKKIDPSVQIFQNQNIEDFIRDCDVMISFSYSTALLDAIVLKKPTVMIVIDKQGLEMEEMMECGATLCISSKNDIEKKLIPIINDDTFRKSLLEKSELFLNRYMSNYGTASEALKNILVQN